MAKVDGIYTLRVGEIEYPVTRLGAKCAIQAGDKFFSPPTYKERSVRWINRTTRALRQDLSKIPGVENVEFMFDTKLGVIVVITMAQENNWGNIVRKVQHAFSVHLWRKSRGYYGS